MSATNKVDLCPLPVDGTLLDVAERADHGLLATTSSSAKHNTLQVWAASRGGTDYDCVASWRSKEIITRLAWAHPEFGPVLAGCSDSGTISIFIQQQPSSAAPDDEDDDEGGHPVFSLATTLKAGEKPIRCCCFAPRQHGLLLAAGSDDGFVYVFEADQQLQPRSWTLQSQFQVAPSVPAHVPPA